MKHPLFVTALFFLLRLHATAEVTRVDVTQRTDLGSSGYEKVAGTIHFALDPANARNQVIVDLDRAPTTPDHRVVFSADLVILRPKAAARSNGSALIEVSNRGGKGMLRLFNRSSASRSDPSGDTDFGDGFLTQQGYTLVWVGWQFDVARDGGKVKLDAPVAHGLSGIVRSHFTASRETKVTLADFAGYTLDPTGPDSLLTVRDGPDSPATAIPRNRWSLRGHTLVLTGGFEPGRNYELVTRATDLPIAGVGLAAFRDTAAWLKHATDAVAPVQRAYAFGSSQSGRFLRTFLYYGFNSDEQGRLVFDGVLSHIAGGARLSLNERGATPNALKAPSPAFPFADTATRDPVSGRTEGLLDNERARLNQPKIFYTNTSVEYWSGDRSAALVHTSPDGRTDLDLPDNVRVYLLSGTQHGPSTFPPSTSAGQQPANPLEYVWTLRALLNAMDRWVRQGTPPPASQYPRLSDGTLVRSTDISFPALPGVRSPRDIPAGREGTAVFPLLVPAVDADGNERAGVRTAELTVPSATYTGWNFRSLKSGGETQLASLLGSAIPLPRTAAEKTQRGDVRLSFAERYPSKECYLALAQAQSDKLVAGGYLLSGDVPQVMKRMEAQWKNATVPAAGGQ